MAVRIGKRPHSVACPRALRRRPAATPSAPELASVRVGPTGPLNFTARGVVATNRRAPFRDWVHVAPAVFLHVAFLGALQSALIRLLRRHEARTGLRLGSLALVRGAALLLQPALLLLLFQLIFPHLSDSRLLLSLRDELVDVLRHLLHAMNGVHLGVGAVVLLEEARAKLDLALRLALQSRTNSSTSGGGGDTVKQASKHKHEAHSESMTNGELSGI